MNGESPTKTKTSTKDQYFKHHLQALNFLPITHPKISPVLWPSYATDTRTLDHCKDLHLALNHTHAYAYSYEI